MKIILNVLLFFAITLIALTYTFQKLSQFNVQVHQVLEVR